MNWTDERVELLKKLWSEGLSASQIAAQLGNVSRNAVIGKVHRLKLSSRGRSNASPAAKKKVAPAPIQKGIQPMRMGGGGSLGGASQPSRLVTHSVGGNALQAQFDMEPSPAPMMRSDNVVVPISRRLKLVELSERTCKWPNGDPMSEDFNFCGNDAKDSGPYCSFHARVAFQPAAERRRAR